MDIVFKFADELGPLKIIHIHEPSVGLKAVLVVDNVACGPSIGGVRMAVDGECVAIAGFQLIALFSVTEKANSFGNFN